MRAIYRFSGFKFLTIGKIFGRRIIADFSIWPESSWYWRFVHLCKTVTFCGFPNRQFSYPRWSVMYKIIHRAITGNVCYCKCLLLTACQTPKRDNYERPVLADKAVFILLRKTGKFAFAWKYPRIVLAFIMKGGLAFSLFLYLQDHPTDA